MNDQGIGVNGGQVGPSNPLDLFSSPQGNATVAVTIDSSPTLTNFSNNSQANANAGTILISEKLKSPVNLIICSVAICLVAGLWMFAGYFIRTLTQEYNSPAVLTYLSVISLQVYFFLIPKRPSFPKRNADGTIPVNETDLGLDTYTNREAFKIAGYLFVLFTLSIGLFIKGLTLFPRSSYCGSIGLLGLLAVVFMIMGMKTEPITRYKLIAVIFSAIAGMITVFESVLWGEIDFKSFLNYGLLFSVGGVIFLALFFVILSHKLEHTHIYKPMLFGFIGLFCMIFMWIVFIPLHIYNIEPLKFPPPKEEAYWYIVGIIFIGVVIPFYLIQWVLTKTSILFVCVLLGSIIPLNGIVEAVYMLEWNWINLLASLFSLSAIIAVHYKYK